MQLDFFKFLTGIPGKITDLAKAKQLPSVSPCVSEPERKQIPNGSRENAQTASVVRRVGRDATLEARARTLLEAAGLKDFAPTVKVLWNGRMRSTAGTASYSKALVTLNPALQAFDEKEIERTFLHELAHLLAVARAGRRRIAAHGPEWKQACADLGIPGEHRCHTLSLPRRSLQRRYAYQCPVCRVIVKRTRPFRRKVACFACCKKHNRGKYHERFRLVSATSAI